LRPLQQILSADAALARWAERRQRERTLLQLVQRELPQALAAHVGAARAEAQELVLVASGGAAAALLRQRSPALVEALKRSGWQFSGIRVGVQARSASRPQTKSSPKQLDAISAARLTVAARKLSDPLLSEALLRIADAGARRGSDDDPLDEDFEDSLPRE
jgi:hypothetical protein